MSRPNDDRFDKIVRDLVELAYDQASRQAEARQVRGKPYTPDEFNDTVRAFACAYASAIDGFALPRELDRYLRAKRPTTRVVVVLDVEGSGEGIDRALAGAPGVRAVVSADLAEEDDKSSGDLSPEDVLRATQVQYDWIKERYGSSIATDALTGTAVGARQDGSQWIVTEIPAGGVVSTSIETHLTVFQPNPENECGALGGTDDGHEARGPATAEEVSVAPDPAGRMADAYFADREPGTVSEGEYQAKLDEIESLASELTQEWFDRYDYPGIEDIGEDEDPIAVLTLRHADVYGAKLNEVLEDLENALNYLRVESCFRVEYNVPWYQNERVCWIEATDEEDARGGDLPRVRGGHGSTPVQVRVESVRRATVDDLEEFVDGLKDCPSMEPPAARRPRSHTCGRGPR